MPMQFTAMRTYGTVLVAAASCLAGPVGHSLTAEPNYHDAEPAALGTQPARRDPMGVSRAQPLEKRIAADFTLDREWKDEVLFGGADAGSDGVEMEVTCIECWTKGVVTAGLGDGDVVDPRVRLDFNGVEAFVNVGVVATGGATYAVNLLSLEDPSGLGIPGLSVGMVFNLDLVFSVSSGIDLSGGFYAKLADASFLETSLLTGEITDHLFSDLAAKPLEMEVQSGAATFKAALRVRVEVGAEADLAMMGTESTAVASMYANIVEFGAFLDSAPGCEVQSSGWIDLNVGAIVVASSESDFMGIGAVVPTVSTTLIDSPTWTRCLADVPPSETGLFSIQTDPAIAEPTPTDEPAGAVLPPPETPVDAETNDETFVKDSAPDDAPKEAKRQVDETPDMYSVPDSYMESPYKPTSTAAPAEDSYTTPSANAPAVYTVTRCAGPIMNCPAPMQQKLVLTGSPSTPNTKKPAAHVFTDVMVLTPCAPITATLGGRRGYTPTYDYETSTAAAESTPCDAEETPVETYPAEESESTSTVTVTRTRESHRLPKPTRTSSAKSSSSPPTQKQPLPVPQPPPPVNTAKPQPHMPQVNPTWMETAAMTSSLMMGNLGGGKPIATPVVPEVVSAPTTSGLVQVTAGASGTSRSIVFTALASLLVVMLI